MKKHVDLANILFAEGIAATEEQVFNILRRMEVAEKGALKFCPFCGNPAVSCAESIEEAYIRCTGCGSRTDYMPSEDSAVTEWNRRTN